MDEKSAQVLARWAKPKFALHTKVETTVGPAFSGIIVAFTIGREGGPAYHIECTDSPYEGTLRWVDEKYLRMCDEQPKVLPRLRYEEE